MRPQLSPLRRRSKACLTSKNFLWKPTKTSARKRKANRRGRRQEACQEEQEDREEARACLRRKPGPGHRPQETQARSGRRLGRIHGLLMAKAKGPRPKHVPIRTCIACRQEAGKRELVRVVRTPSGSVQVDPTGKLAGRGAYICRTRACWEQALQGQRLGRGAQDDVDRSIIWQSCAPTPQPCRNHYSFPPATGDFHAGGQTTADMQRGGGEAKPAFLTSVLDSGPGDRPKRGRARAVAR